MADAAVRRPPPTASSASFANGVVKIGTGTAVAQLVAILASPLLTRLFGPEAFGAAAIFGSSSTILILIACLRYELAIVLPKEEAEAANLLALSVLLAVATAILVLAITWVARHQIARWFGSPDSEWLALLLPASVALGGTYSALNYWITRTKRFGQLSTARMSYASLASGSQLTFGLTGLTTGGVLIGGSVLGTGVSTILLAAQTWYRDGALFKGAVRWQHIRGGLSRYRKFPIYGVWSTLLNTASWQLPTFLLAAYFSPSVVGFYALSNRLFRLPMSVVGGAISQVFFQRASEAKHDGDLASVVEGVFRRLVIMGMFPTTILSVVGRDLFIVAFGPRWAEAGVYVQILSVWTLFWFISAPLSTLFSVLEKQQVSLRVNALLFGSRWVVLAIGGALGDARLALGLFAASGIVLYGWVNDLVMQAAGVPRRRVYQTILREGLRATPATLALIALKVLGVSPLLVVGFACIVGMYYVIYVLVREPELREALLRIPGISRLTRLRVT